LIKSIKFSSRKTPPQRPPALVSIDNGVLVQVSRLTITFDAFFDDKRLD
jgi:hypothetical protein